MADRIKGITIELDGDTTKLSKALAGVNKEVKSTQTALKDVDKLLKLDPKNTELLQQKHELLGKQVSNTKEKLDELKKAQANMDTNGVEKSSNEYMALRREIIDCEDSLRNLEKAADQSNVAMQKISATAKGVGVGAQKVADKTKALSGAAAGILGGLAAAGGKAIATADDLNTMAKQTGFSTDDLQKFQYAADLVDVSVSDITGAAAKMKKGMGEAGIAVGDVTVKTVDAAGQFRSVNDIFYDVVAALGQVTNETERDQIAMDIFGKSADSLAGIIDDGGAALRAYGDEAERAGLIMSRDTLDSLNEVGDSIDKVKASATATLSSTGAKAIEAAMPIIERVVDAIGQALEWLGGLNAEQIGFLATLLAIVAAISPVASIVAGIASAVSAVLPVLSTVFAFIAANPIVLVIASIIAAIALLIKNWDKVKKTTVDVFNAIKNIGGAAADAIKRAFSRVIDWAKNAVDGVMGTIDKVKNAVSRLFGGGGSVKTSGTEVGAMADGGILRHGMSLVGERGPELLTVDGGRAVVQPLNVSAASGVTAPVAGWPSSGNINVNISYTGSLSQLARIMQPEITIENNRIGPSLVTR